MKCPHCGQWNRASLPICQRCGEPLDPEQDAQPAWRGKLKDDYHGAAYYRADEDGELAGDADARDTLAEEMAELKLRKAEGARQLRRMRQESAARSAANGATVRTHTTADSFWAGVDADPRQTIRVRRTDAGRGSRTVVHRVDAGPVWDEDILAYDAGWRERQELAATGWKLPQDAEFTQHLPSRSRRIRKTFRFFFTLFLLALIGLCVFFGLNYFQQQQDAEKQRSGASVVASIKDDLAAHTIMIPGDEGASIYIRELHTAYIVTGGFATIEVLDHTWYDTLEEFPEGNLLITLTPYLKTASGQQRPLDVIEYEIEIPESPITLITPDSLRTDVSASMYALSFNVRPGSTVFVNDRNVTDTVNADGNFTYNATVQAIGDNLINVRVRSQYCRETVLPVVLYRAPQEIPLDLAADTYTSTNNKAMLVNATTLPGATITVDSKFTDLDVTNLDTTGAFSFYAVFDTYGYNTIKITASYPGRKSSVIEYQVYYVPNADVYTPKAWALDASGYAELVGNISVRAERTQVYVVMGYVDHFVSTKPQMAVIYTGADNKSQPVLVENYTQTSWEEGQYYRIYADVHGSYSNMPWLYARYTYTH